MHLGFKEAGVGLCLALKYPWGFRSSQGAMHTQPLQYAWDIGVAANRLNIKNEGHPTTPLISQPPHDSKRFNASMYHYTWGERAMGSICTATNLRGS